MSYLIAVLMTVQVGYATMFGDTTEDMGGTPACTYRLSKSEMRRLLPKGCAHRTLPCGTRLEVVRMWRGRLLHATCRVVDRGPNGRRRDGSYRGVVDMMPAPAREVRVGRAVVLLWAWPTWR